MLWYKLSAQSKAVDFDAWLVFNLIDRGLLQKAIKALQKHYMVLKYCALSPTPLCAKLMSLFYLLCDPKQFILLHN